MTKDRGGESGIPDSPGASRPTPLPPAMPTEAGGDPGTLIRLDQLARATGVDVHRSAWFRWADRGVLARDGTTRVRLRTVKVGGRRYATVADFEDFVRRQNEGPGGDGACTPSRGRLRRLEDVEAELDAMGL